jgi:hypothetical protein
MSVLPFNFMSQSQFWNFKFENTLELICRVLKIRLVPPLVQGSVPEKRQKEGLFIAC